MDHPQQTNEEPRPGADNYLLGAEIARGGMGSILEARDIKLSRTVAVKVLLPDSDVDEAMKLRFIREAIVLSRLAHPNIVPIHDIVWEGGMPLFYTMKLVRGRTLQRILDGVREGHRELRAEYTLDRLLTVFRKVCDAIAFAHSMGVLHRDLKPENIMVGEFGEVLVMDWGVAKLLSASPDDALAAEPEPASLPARPAGRGAATLHGVVIGTPQFMSPEQARGEVNEHDERSDIYSLGAVLYAILTLRSPGDQSSMVQELRDITASRTPRGTVPLDVTIKQLAAPAGAVPHCPGGRVPPALSAVAAKALAREKADRFQSVRDLAADIERFQGGFATTAEHAGLWKEFQLLVLRHKTAAALLAVLLAVSIGFLIKVVASERRAQTDKETARHALARSAISLAESALREGNGPGIRAALEDVPRESRDSTWSYLLAESDTSRPLPPIGIADLDDLVADPSRPHIFAAVERGGKIVTFDVRTGAQQSTFTAGFTPIAKDAALCLTITKDGSRIAVGRSRGENIVIHNARSGRLLSTLPAPSSARLEFSPDGNFILQVNEAFEILNMWDLRSGALRWSHKDAYQSARFTADGQRIASYSWGPQLRLINAADGSQIGNLAGNYLSELAVQPSGPLLVAGNGLGTIRGFDVLEGRPRFEFQPHEGAVRHVAFLAGGERFLTAAKLPDGRQALQFWNAASTRLCQTLTGGSGEIRNIALHPVSGELIVLGQSTRVWDSIGVPPLAVMRSGNANPSAVFWGSRDMIFAPGPSSTSATLQSLTNPLDPAVKWAAETGDHGQPSVSADGKRMAIARYHSGHNIAVLDWDEGRIKQVAALPPMAMPDYVRISPAGDRVALVANDFTQLVVIDVHTGKRPIAFKAPGVLRFNDVAWLLNGNRLAGIATTGSPRSTPGSRDEVVLWDTATGEVLLTAACPAVSNVLCAAPDGTRVAEAGTDRTVRIRDSGTLRVLTEFRVHNAPVSALGWHPLRPILATAGEDLVIRLWNLQDGSRMEELRGPLAPPNVLSFSPDGTRLSTASVDGAARIWEPRTLAQP